MGRQRASLYLGLVACLILSAGANGQDVSFREPGRSRTEYPVGSNPRNGIATGDFNNDGRPDVLVANAFQNTVSLLLATPDGSSFEPARTFAAFASSGSTTQIAVGDVNNDGNLDIVAVSNFGGIVSLLLGNGDGTFRSPTGIPGSFGFPTFVVLVDLNGDNKLDVAVTSDSGTLNVALGNGDGTFQSPRSTTLGSSPSAITYGDFNDIQRPLKADHTPEGMRQSARRTYRADGKAILRKSKFASNCQPEECAGTIHRRRILPGCRPGSSAEGLPRRIWRCSTARSPGRLGPHKPRCLPAQVLA